MKKISLLLITALFFACSADDAEMTTEDVSMFVNHYKTTNILSGTALVVQENEDIGSGKFEPLGRIKGFEFEPGFTYRLTATKTVTKNAGTDFRTASYELEEVLSRDAVDPNTTFRVDLSTVTITGNYVLFLSRTIDSTFVLGGKIPIECNRFCGDLNSIIDENLMAVGTFTHGENGTYILAELEN